MLTPSTKKYLERLLELDKKWQLKKLRTTKAKDGQTEFEIHDVKARLRERIARIDEMIEEVRNG